MHEMSLCESMLTILEDKARSEGFQKVKSVWVEIGKLSCVEVEALRFCFEVVTRDSLAHDAKLEIIDIPGEAWCMQCAKPVPVNQRYAECPDCGSYQLQVTGGTEMRIKELEVE